MTDFIIQPTPHLSHRLVPGDGPDNAIVMIIGEAPGEQEDKEGKPFIGPAGKILNEALDQAGLPRAEVYVTNIVKSRPPNNRQPTQEEIEAHIGYLVAEWRRIRPTHVLLLGNTALHTLTNLTDGISKRRGIIPSEHSAITQSMVYATYHPSAILHQPSLKESFQQDIIVFAKIVKEATNKGMYTELEKDGQ